MRISDWSSDVCSSDLLVPDLRRVLDRFESGRVGRPLRTTEIALPRTGRDHQDVVVDGAFLHAHQAVRGHAPRHLVQPRSEERRVGKECVSTCQCRWLQANCRKTNNTKKKINNK